MNDTRCRRSDGKQWRCREQAMYGKAHCEKHVISLKLRAESWKRRKSNYDRGVLKNFLKKSKVNGDGGGFNINRYPLGAWEGEEDEEEVWRERDENPISTFTRRRNSSGGNLAERNPVEPIQHSQSPLYSPSTGEDEEAEDALDKKIASGEDEEADDAFDKFFKLSDDMQADLDRAIKTNKELAKRNNSLTEELCKAKEQSRKKLIDMKAKLDKAELANRDLDERNNKLKEELNRAKERGNSSERNLGQTRKKLQKLCRTFSAVKEECDQVCREQEQTGAAPHLSTKRKYVLKVYEVNDWVNCSICLETWTESGEHNACSLSCGHFFGRSCITQWISRNGSRDSSTCPVCSKRTTLSDIRHHYVSQIYDGKEKFEHGD